VDLHVVAAVGQPVHVTARTVDGIRCEASTAEAACEATRHAVDEDVLRNQLGRLGGTPFELRSLTAHIEGRPMVPFSILGKLRHDMVAALEAAAVAPVARQIRVATDGTPHRGRDGVTRADAPPVARGLPELHVLVRSLDQLRSVLDLGERNVYADFADIRRYGEAVTMCRDSRATIHLATPRIQKPDEIGIYRLLAKQRPDGILVRTFSGLLFFRDLGLPVVGDFSLNVTNERTAEFLVAEGLRRVTASYDLNRDQLLALVAATPPDWLEVVIHQHMPMFHMEHCVFCAVLSPGTNKTNCGRPCDDHVVRLRDRIGVEHLLTADVGCRNTLFNAVPQSAAEAVPQLAARGIGHFRVELLDEEADAIRDVILAYRDLLAGGTTGREVWTRLKAANRVGVTRGTLEERRDPLAIL
jgi:putative protease